MNPSLFIH